MSYAWKIDARQDAGFVEESVRECLSTLIEEFSTSSNMHMTVDFYNHSEPST